MSDKKLENLVSEYSELAKDKNVDVAALMINALQQEDQNMVSTRTKRWLYILSLGVPPIGFLFALYYWFREESDARQVAYWCIGLTVISLLATIILFAGIFKSAGVTPQQIEQIKPSDIRELEQ